jgi:hypothetical protein
MVTILLHPLPLFILLVTVVLSGCGGGYDPPDSQVPDSGADDTIGGGQAIDFEGQWRLLALSSEAAHTDLETSDLDVVLDIAVDGAARWYVKEDGQNYSYCSADDMVLAQDDQANHRVSLSYYHVLIDPQTRQVTENDGLRQTTFRATLAGGDRIELQNGQPLRGVVMLPEFDTYNEQDPVSLTLQAVDVDLSGSAPTQKSVLLCDIKSGIVDSPVDEQAPMITRFDLTSETPATDSAIAFDLEGQDDVAISAWLINESAAIPAVDDAAWSQAKPAIYTLSAGYGMKTVYAWVKDAAGNIGDSASISVDYIMPPDSPDEEPPVITQFALTSETPTSDPVIAFDLEGEDNVAVSAWLIHESAAVPAMDDASWSGSKPAGCTLSAADGMKTIYAWAKDAAGNISDPATINIEYIVLPPCQYVETVISPTDFLATYKENVAGIIGDLSSLESDDDVFLEMRIFDDSASMYLMADFELADTNVRDLKVSVASISRRYGFRDGRAFQRSVDAYNHSTEMWDPVGETVHVGDSEEVRSDIDLAGNVDTISDYLEQVGDGLTFRVRIGLTASHNLYHKSRYHGLDLVQLTVTHPQDSNCVDE